MTNLTLSIRLATKDGKFSVEEVVNTETNSWSMDQISHALHAATTKLRSLTDATVKPDVVQNSLQPAPEHP
jgi:hypothetical protein